MKLAAILRVKNQILTIRECLSKLSSLVDKIVIVDNDSTDGTFGIYKRYPKIRIIKKTKGFNEGRDKCLAHKLAKKLKPDWILWIDGDEIFEKNLVRNDLEKYMNNPRLNQINFRIYNFWLSDKKYRVDGIWKKYTAFPQRQLWRNLPQAYFLDIPFHNGGIRGVPPKHINSDFRIKHFGYVYPQQIKTKVKTYKKLENDELSTKTLPLNIDDIHSIKWLESDNKNYNKIIRKTEYSFWQLMEKFYLYKDLLVKKYKIF